MDNGFNREINIEGEHKSLWLSSVSKTNFPALKDHLKADVAVIGGGLTGLTCAYVLTQAGLKVILIEKGRLMSATSGHTTAKITSNHGLIYQYLLAYLSKEQAQIYAQANQSAVSWIQAIIEGKKIDCSYQKASAYTYAPTEKELKKIEAEVKAAQSLGLPVFYKDSISAPFKVKGAIGFKDQALFHPAKYMLGLIDYIVGNGGLIYENTMAVDVEDSNPCQIITDKGSFSAGQVIVATMYPFLKEGNFFSKLYPHQSYVLAAKVEKMPEGMYFSAGPYSATVRPYYFKDEKLIIFGGDTHKVGKGGDTISRYESLKNNLFESFGPCDIKYYWSTHDSVSVDRVPYIGRLSSRTKNVFLAAGFKQWGITHSAVAAIILLDLINGKKNEWLNLFDSCRSEPGTKRPPFENNASEKVIKTMLKVVKDTKEIKDNSALILEKDKEKTGVYMDKSGQLKAVGLKCSHMGCEVNFNNAESTWDCPCHGSRFNADGEVEYAPACKPLEKKIIGKSKYIDERRKQKAKRPWL